MTPEPVRHAPRPNSPSVIPAKAGIHPPTRYATITPEAARHAPRPNQVGDLGPADRLATRSTSVLFSPRATLSALITTSPLTKPGSEHGP